MAAESIGTFSRIRRVTRGEIGLTRKDFRIGRDQEDVVEGESFFEDAHA
jgi:hypothetical protein